MWLHTGVYRHYKRVCTESWRWEKNPVQHWGVKPTSAACGSNTSLTKLQFHPNFWQLMVWKMVVWYFQRTQYLGRTLAQPNTWWAERWEFAKQPALCLMTSAILVMNCVWTVWTAWYHFSVRSPQRSALALMWKAKSGTILLCCMTEANAFGIMCCYFAAVTVTEIYTTTVTEIY